MNAILIELTDKTVYLAKLEPKLPSEQPLTDKDKVILDLHKQIEQLKSKVNNVVLDAVNGSTLVEILKAQTDFKLAIEIQNHVAENVFTYIINEHGVKLTYEEWRKTVKTYYR